MTETPHTPATFSAAPTHPLARDLQSPELSMALAPYKGSDVVGNTIKGAGFWGLVGGTVGEMLGTLGSKSRQNPKYHPLKTDHLRPILAISMAGIGGYRNMRQAQLANEQFHGLQQTVRQQYDRIGTLTNELNTQLIARLQERDANLRWNDRPLAGTAQAGKATPDTENPRPEITAASAALSPVAERELAIALS